MLVVSIFTRVGRVASVYMGTKYSSNSKLGEVWKSEDCIDWVGSVARICRLENEGNVTSVAKEIIV